MLIRTTSYLFAVLLAVAVLSSCGKKENHVAVPAPAPDALANIPPEVIRGVALRTLGPSPSDVQVTDRHAQVREWLISIGAGTGYKTYRETYGPPIDHDTWLFAEPRDLSSRRLGYYYLHQPLISGEVVTATSCMNPAISTAKGFCGIANYNAFLLTGEPKYRVAFLKWADWFVQNHKNGAWYWDTSIPVRGIKPPWISALTQSVGISLLLRAYQDTGKRKYLDVATKAFGWMKLPVAHRGVAFSNANGTWLEEYPNKDNPSHVFNGHVWGLFGVYDYYRVTGDKSALALFNAGVRVIKAEIDNYDIGNWVVYAQTNRVDAMYGGYMQFVVEQMRVIFNITGDPFFAERADRWQKYQETDALFVDRIGANFLTYHPNLAVESTSDAS